MITLRRIAPWVSLVWALAACTPQVGPQPTASPFVIGITADGQSQRYELTGQVTAREAVALAGIALDETDRLSLPPFQLLRDGDQIIVTRVRETTAIEEMVVPFQSRTVRNDALPAGERRLLQAGSNGREELTYRTVFEDGVQVSRNVIRRVVIEPAVDEVIMVGAQSTFSTVPITGTLAFLNGGNGWALRGISSERYLVTASSDLDGRVFDLSPEGEFLLYTRAITDSGSELFNQLFVVNVLPTGPQLPIQLPADNVLYAEWVALPDQPPTIVYSTADKVATAPGWQANNDLWLLSWEFNPEAGELEVNPVQVQDASSGGAYGWWGTGFAVSPDATQIAYARTDSIGVIDLATFGTRELTRFVAYNSRSDWAWYPTLRWAPNGWLYTVTHAAPTGLELPEDSTAFDLTALYPADGARIDLIDRVGLFANPIPAPDPSGQAGRIAYLQAIEPENSPFSRYRLFVVDADGSNARALFPPEDQPGLEAGQLPDWSPDARVIAVLSGGNLWLVDPLSGQAQQLTGDSLTSHLDWEP